MTRDAEGQLGHVPVLATQVLDALGPAEGGVYVDCTAGLGGHAAMVAARLGATGTAVLNDLDPGNLERAGARVRGAFGGRVECVRGSFADLPEALVGLGLRADMVLADLGFASNQVDDPDRGLSFRRDGPLDMRLDPSAPITAAELVGSLSVGELAEILRRYGEERDAGRIARKVVEARAGEPIETTGRLAEVVRAAVPRRAGGGSQIDPATKTFQALRIAVNDELGSLEQLLASIERDARRLRWLAPGARVGIISFHSLEDRPVKQAFAALVRDGAAEVIGGAKAKGPAVAGEEEIAANPRARSAKLRSIRLIAGQDVPA